MTAFLKLIKTKEFERLSYGALEALHSFPEHSVVRFIDPDSYKTEWTVGSDPDVHYMDITKHIWEINKKFIEVRKGNHWVWLHKVTRLGDDFCFFISDEGDVYEQI